MDIVVQWATILSPIIAVGMAAWVIWESQKDTNKQVNAIKKLTIVQTEITIIQNEIELYKTNLKLQQAQELEFNENGIEAFQIDAWKLGEMQRKNKQSHLNKEYYHQLQNKLQQKQKELIALKNELAGL